MKTSYLLQKGTDNKILRNISEKVDKIDGDIKEFSNELLKLMFERDGVGLAAPQAGINQRIIATTQRRKKKLVKETIMINPIITHKSEQMIVEEESCLSLPNISGNVKRHQNIIVEYLDTKGQKQIKKLKNLNAVIVQHEIDHLDGILFIDKAISNSIKKNQPH